MVLKTLVAIFIFIHSYIHIAIAFIFPSDEPEYLLRETWFWQRLGLEEQGISLIGKILSITSTLLFNLSIFSMYDFIITSAYFEIIIISASIISLLLYLTFWQKQAIIGVTIDVLIIITVIFGLWESMDLIR